jgi:hypothetical protein
MPTIKRKNKVAVCWTIDADVVSYIEKEHKKTRRSCSSIAGDLMFTMILHKQAKGK